MAYTKQTWVNNVSPLNATRMNYIETGIEDAHNLVHVPVGAMMQYAGASAPSGWLLCDGASLLRAGQYNALFTALGGTGSPWGLPDGTHFNVPDLRGRLPVGKGTHTDVDALAENDGAALADRRPKHKHTPNESNHTHTISDPQHSHTYDASTSPYTSDTATGIHFGQGVTHANYSPGIDAASTGITGTNGASTGLTIGPQTAGTPTDTPSFVVVNYIIKY